MVGVSVVFLAVYWGIMAFTTRRLSRQLRDGDTTIRFGIHTFLNPLGPAPVRWIRFCVWMMPIVSAFMVLVGSSLGVGMIQSGGPADLRIAGGVFLLVFLACAVATPIMLFLAVKRGGGCARLNELCKRPDARRN